MEGPAPVERLADGWPWMRFGVVVDVGMLFALASLSYWVGIQANKIDQLGAQVLLMQTQVATLSANAVDIAAMKERERSLESASKEQFDFISLRLERIERKVDNLR
jgi:hypothetical protein